MDDLARAAHGSDGTVREFDLRKMADKLGDFAGTAQDAQNELATLTREGKAAEANIPENSPLADSEIDNVVAGVNAWTGHGIMAGFIAPAAIGAVAKVANLVRFKSAANALGGVQDYMHKPFGETGLGKVVVGGANAVLTPLSHVAESMQGAGLFAGKKARTELKAANQQALVTGALGRIEAHAASAPGQLGNALGQLHASLHAGGVATDGAMTKETLELLPKVEQLALKEGHKAVAQELKQLPKLANKLNVAHTKAQAWANMPEAMRKGAAEWGKKNDFHGGLDKTLWGISSATSTYMTVHDLSSDLKALKYMVADMTGQKADDIGFGQLMLGKLPEPAAAVRAHLIKTGGPRALAEAANLAFNVNHILGRGAAWMMLPMIGLSVGIGFLGGNEVLDIYKVMKKNEAARQPNTPEMYAQLVGETSKELKERGGAESKFASAVGALYAEKQYTVAQVLQAVNSGQLLKDIEQIKKSAEAAPTKHEEKAEAPAEAAPSVSYADTVGRTARPREELLARRSRVDSFTSQINHGRQKQQLAETPAMAGP